MITTGDHAERTMIQEQFRGEIERHQAREDLEGTTS
jgi:hypothetical protein